LLSETAVVVPWCLPGARCHREQRTARVEGYDRPFAYRSRSVDVRGLQSFRLAGIPMPNAEWIRAALMAQPYST
jgi:hypothetical protein